MIQINPKTPNALSGKKTFLVAGLMIAYAIGGMGLGYVDPSDGVPLVMEAAAIIMLRLGIRKAEV